jgi:hypothetical protein
MGLHKRLLTSRKFLEVAFGLGIACALFVNSATAFASPNFQINYQGKLTDSTNMAVPDGPYEMEFNIYTEPSGSPPVWTQTYSGANEVQVTSGLFSVMLGSTSPLTSVDFNQTLYLGVTIEADAEMTPRKILGASPAAFIAAEASDAALLGGIASTSFVRSNEPDAIVTTSTSTLLSISQFGAGDILNLENSIGEVFTVTAGGRVGIGTTSPTAELSVNGDFALTGGIYDKSATLGNSGDILQTDGSGIFWVSTTTLGLFETSAIDTYAELDALVADVTLTHNGLFDTSLELSGILTDETGTGALVFANSPTFTGRVVIANATTTNLTITGAFYDNANSAGSNGMVLQSTGAGFSWVATSTLGIQSGASDFLSLSDTISVYNAGRILFESGSAVTDSSDFTFSAGTLTVGGLSLTDGLIAFSSAATTTIANNDPYAFTIATSTGGEPLLRIDTTSGGETISLGTVGSDIYIGKHGSPTDLIFQDNSVISGTGTTTLTFGTSSDLIIFAVNVGIGTTTPSQKLTVGGNTWIDGDLTATGTVTFSDLVNGLVYANGSGILSATSTLSAAFIEDRFLRNDGDDTTAGSLTALEFIASDSGATSTFAGKVGIGTTTPSQKLTVAGGARITGSLYDNTNSAGSNGMVLQSTGSGFAWVATSTLGFGSGGGLSASDIDTSSKLDTIVTDDTGTGRLVFSNAPAFSGTATFSALTATSTLTLSGTAANIALGSNYLSGDGDDEGIYIGANGKVGIGTTTPSAKLDITGTAGSDDIFSISSSTNSRLFTVDAAGNVGIGVSDPTYKLEIENSAGATISFGESNAINYARFGGGRGMIGYGGSSDTGLVLQAGATRGIRFNVNNS